jgi:hypothetical protein
VSATFLYVGYFLVIIIPLSMYCLLRLG